MHGGYLHSAKQFLPFPFRQLINQNTEFPGQTNFNEDNIFDCEIVMNRNHVATLYLPHRNKKKSNVFTTTMTRKQVDCK